MTDNEFCSAGLLAFALTGHVHGNLGECGEVLAGVIRDQFPDRVNGPLSAYSPERTRATIYAFNDHPDTTWEDVERVFEKAEVAWDERV